METYYDIMKEQGSVNRNFLVYLNVIPNEKLDDLLFDGGDEYENELF